MRSPGINGEGELKGQPAKLLTQVHLEKWPLRQSVCVWVGMDLRMGPKSYSCADLLTGVIIYGIQPQML